MKRKPLRIYIAGPYCPKDCSIHDASRIATRNIDKAIEIGNALIEKGHYVFIPHLSHYVHIHYSCQHDYETWWYEEDLTFLEHWADSLYFIAPSAGANMELEIAKRLGLKIFYSLAEVPELPTSFKSKTSTEDLEKDIEKFVKIRGQQR